MTETVRGRDAAPVPTSATRDPVRLAELRAAAELWGLPTLDPAAIAHALTHSSAAPARSPSSNERLEFVGDAIVNAVVAEYLYLQYPGRLEGDLAKGRALVVSKGALYGVGLRLGLPELISVGTTAAGLFARSRRAMTADAFEALVAVVYLQLGWDAARDFVIRAVAPELETLRERRDLRDAKTVLQERAQAVRCAAPVYRTVSEHGDAHSRTFTAEVTLYDGVTATGVGRSKKDAQQAAAAAALASYITDGPEPRGARH